VDHDFLRSGVFTFFINNTLPLNWSEREVYADGLRNEVGLSFDSEGRLWGVENGADNLFRPDLGGDIHLNNPGEELVN